DRTPRGTSGGGRLKALGKRPAAVAFLQAGLRLAGLWPFPISTVVSGERVRSGQKMHVSGPFEVKVTPQGPEDRADGSTLGRLSIDKQFHGALEAVSQGQMLSAVAEGPGSAGYVAVERVTGTLGGHRGSFVLQHCGTMSKTGSQL